MLISKISAMIAFGNINPQLTAIPAFYHRMWGFSVSCDSLISDTHPLADAHLLGYITFVPEISS